MGIWQLANKTPRFTSYSINTLRGNSYISSEKASRELGYKTRPIKKSIEDTFEWFEENKIL
jgi:dihydroflavonol-4-reductase